jgi:hypothetical protein
MPGIKGVRVDMFILKNTMKKYLHDPLNSRSFAVIHGQRIASIPVTKIASVS